MNTKAMSEKTLITVLIFIVAFLVIGFIAVKIFDIMTSKGDTESCRLSVLAASQTTIAGKTSIELQCPRKNIVVYPEYYTVDGNKRKYSSEEYTENVKRVFAEEMRECWYKMGEGDVKVFEDKLLDNENVCLICNHIEFQNPSDPEITAFQDYLENTKIPASLNSLTDTTYYDYIHRDINQKIISKDTTISNFLNFFGIGGDIIQSNIIIGGTGSLTTHSPYEIIFFGIKKGILEPREKSTYLMVVVPSEDITTSMCSYIYS